MQNSELHILDLSPEGLGVAQWTRPDGLVRPCLVHSALVGETVEAEIFRTKKNKTASFAARIQSLKIVSESRVQPRCKHFGSCGGCVWQHMKYEEQLAVKEARIKKLFAPDAKILPIIACPSPWKYRNKMEFSFSQDAKGTKFLGLILQGSKGRVFTVEECHLMNPWVANTVQAVYAWWQESDLLAYYLPKNRGSLRNLTVRESQGTKDRVIILTVSGNPEYALKKTHLTSFVECCQRVATPDPEGKLTIILRIQQALKGSPTQFFEMVLAGPDHFRESVQINGKAHEFVLSPNSFFQPNVLQADLLYQTALDMAELTKEKVLYDLYAGIGMFGMLASSYVKEAIAIELSRDAAYDAKVNADRLQLANFRMMQGDVALVLEQEGLPAADVAIVDPPRSGLTKAAISQIIKLAPQKLVYVSCNPVTQAQDIKELTENGFSLVYMQPIEQFPHTIHVENIALLECISQSAT